MAADATMRGSKTKRRTKTGMASLLEVPEQEVLPVKASGKDVGDEEQGLGSMVGKAKTYVEAAQADDGSTPTREGCTADCKGELPSGLPGLLSQPSPGAVALAKVRRIQAKLQKHKRDKRNWVVKGKAFVKELEEVLAWTSGVGIDDSASDESH